MPSRPPPVRHSSSSSSNAPSTSTTSTAALRATRRARTALTDVPSGAAARGRNVTGAASSRGRGGGAARKGGGGLKGGTEGAYGGDAAGLTGLNRTLQGPQSADCAVKPPISARPDRLRVWVRDALKLNMFVTAAFWGDKLVSITGDVVDVYLLAQTYFLTEQYSRAIALLSMKGSGFLPCRYLQAQCLMKLDRHDDGLQLLEEIGGSHEHRVVQSVFTVTAHREAGINIAACQKYLQGVAFQARKDYGIAKSYFRESLSLDVRCYEAFDALISGHMLTAEDEVEMIESMDFDAHCGEDSEFVKLLYCSRLQNYKTVEKSRTIISILEKTYHLKDNGLLMLSTAEAYSNECQFSKSLEYTSRIIEKDPLNLECLWTHVKNLSQLAEKNTLFLLAHELVDKHPTHPVSWFAVGCYYLLCKKNSDARKYFERATDLDSTCLPAWIGYAHCFAFEGDHDQAISAYSQALRHFRGIHLPTLFVGMEHLQTKNLILGEEFIKAAHSMCLSDPLVENELGVVYYYKKDYTNAVIHLKKALELAHEDVGRSTMWKSTWNNLGHSYFKLGKHAEARSCFEKVISMSPDDIDATMGLGLIEHTLWNLDDAIIKYHEALALNSDNTLCKDLLRIALDDAFRMGLGAMTDPLADDPSLVNVLDDDFRMPPILFERQQKRKSSAAKSSPDSARKVSKGKEKMHADDFEGIDEVLMTTIDETSSAKIPAFEVTQAWTSDPQPVDNVKSRRDYLRRMSGQIPDSATPMQPLTHNDLMDEDDDADKSMSDISFNTAPLTKSGLLFGVKRKPGDMVASTGKIFDTPPGQQQPSLASSSLSGSFLSPVERGTGVSTSLGPSMATRSRGGGGSAILTPGGEILGGSAGQVQTPEVSAGSTESRGRGGVRASAQKASRGTSQVEDDGEDDDEEEGDDDVDMELD
ncbi:anaphase promoting complex subunit cdc16 [Chytridiales sp. JEL 0842]|nr:anaphase promoting complex subunit cdc16 [Chytridiales sp. JEL 0842]